MRNKILPIYIINFLLAISGTMGMTFLPLLATEKLGLSLLLIGIVEGGTELLSSILRVLTGNAFDNIKNKKLLFLFPVSFAFLGKTLLFMPSAATIFISKTMERISNGAFASPRDAYIGANSKNKGMGMSLLNITKTAGCILGSAAISIYTLFGYTIENNLDGVIFVSCLMCFIALITTFFIKIKNSFKVKENNLEITKEGFLKGDINITRKGIFVIDGIKEISVGYHIPEIKKEEAFNFNKIKVSFNKLLPIYILALFFFLGRFNDGLIIIFLKNNNLPEWFYLATISIFNTIMMLVSPIFGHYIDKNKGKLMLYVTFISLLLFNVIFYNINYMTMVMGVVGLIFWGIQRAGAQITFTSTIFKNIPINSYGSAIGIYSCISGVGTFISSILSGYLAQISFSYVFILSGLFATISLISSYVMMKNTKLLNS